MTFIEFISRIFIYFNQLLISFKNVFNLLIENNIIKLSLCIGILIFIVEYQFEILHLLPRILGLSGEQEKEYITKSHTQSSSGIDKNTGVRNTYTITHTKRKKVK